MRKILFTVVFLIASFISFSQTYYISTEGACISNLQTKDVLDCDEDYATLIELDGNGKIMKQTNKNMSSNYYIKSNEVKDNILWMYVISDAGNEYAMAYDKYGALFYCVNVKENYFWTYRVKGAFQK